MQGHRGERGAALILLIAITAVLAILAATMVMVLANHQHATAAERTRKASQANSEGALDTAICLAKTKTFSQTDGTWLTPAELAEAYAAGFDGAVLPEGMSVEFFVYDNSLGKAAYDANGDGIMWVEDLMTYRGKTTRMRVMVRQTEESVISAFPKAVVYSDSGISLEDTSDVYAVKNDGVTPWSPAPPYATTVMAGGGWDSGMPSGAKDFTANSSANLAAPGSSVQSVNLQVNGSVSPSGKFNGTIIGGVGLLSDYFDQAAQADLGDEAQAGEAPATAPLAPTAPAAPAVPSPTPTTTLTSADRTDIQSSSTTTPFTKYANTSVKTAAATNITITRTTARTLSFKDLYVTGNLSVTGPVTLNISGFLRVDGTLTINNTTVTPVIDTFSGPVYAAGTGSSSMAGKVTVNAASSVYARGPLAIRNTATTVGQVLYSAGALSMTGAATVNAATVCSGGAMTIGNTATTTGQLYSVAALGMTGNTTVTATSSAYSGGALTISGATSAVTDTFGSLYVAGTGGSSVAGTVTLNATASLYAGGPLTMSNTAVNTGLFYTADDLSLTGNVTARSRALVVLGGSDQTDTDFAISGATLAVVDQFGPIWVKGTCAWSGTASVRTTDYLYPTAAPAPMYVGILDRSGTYADVYGATWCVGNAGTSDVAVRFAGPTAVASTVMCPLLATTEKTVTTGKVNFGTMAAPMVYYMVCDNDTLYSNTCEWGSSGTLYGLMVVMEACLVITGGNGSTPCVVGAVFNGTPYKSGTSASVNDITLTGASTVAYSQAVIDAIMTTSVRTTTTVTQIVPGSWQQLPVN